MATGTSNKCSDLFAIAGSRASARSGPTSSRMYTERPCVAITRSTEEAGMLSVSGVQVTPPEVDFHRPPVAAPT